MTSSSDAKDIRKAANLAAREAIKVFAEQTQLHIQCKNCMETKLYTNFTQNAVSKSGFLPKCKPCVNKYQRLHRKKNTDLINAVKAVYSPLVMLQAPQIIKEPTPVKSRLLIIRHPPAPKMELPKVHYTSELPPIPE
jgi:hypothetical protein